MSDFKQIQIPASSRGILDYFFCFTCDEYVWDCDHYSSRELPLASVSPLSGSTAFWSTARNARASIGRITERSRWRASGATTDFCLYSASITIDFGYLEPARV